MDLLERRLRNRFAKPLLNGGEAHYDCDSFFRYSRLCCDVSQIPLTFNAPGDRGVKEMRITAIGIAVVGLVAFSFQAAAQQKTVRACQEEWRANKAANQSAGITEKAYVAQCRGGGATAQPTTPTGPAETTAAPPGAKTAKACREEWRSNKAENQAKGITEKAYVEQCRTGAATAAPTPAAPPPTSAQPSTVPSRRPRPKRL